MSKLIDLTNQTFNYWTVLKRAENTSDGKAQWLCRCKCGNQKIVLGKSLRNGHSKSCGCLKKEKNQERLLLNLTGQRFGHLVALERMPQDFNKTKNKKRYWKCKCDCGNITYVSTGHLRSGAVQSCGCNLSSRGETKIREILKEHNIPFQEQKQFPTCFFKESNYPARFDFYVNNQYLIEYDGIQHFQVLYEKNSGWNNQENLKKTQKHDTIKNDWCKNNNIPLIRIPYTHFNDITLQDLLLDTSSFIV